MFSAIDVIADLVELIVVELAAGDVVVAVATAVGSKIVIVEVEGELVIILVVSIAACVEDISGIAVDFVAVSLFSAFVDFVNVVEIDVFELNNVGAVVVTARVIVVCIDIVDDKTGLAVISVIPVVVCVDVVDGVAVVFSATVPGDIFVFLFTVAVDAVNMVGLVVFEVPVICTIVVIATIVAASVVVIAFEAELAVVSVFPVVANVEDASGIAVVISAASVGDVVVVSLFSALVGVAELCELVVVDLVVVGTVVMIDTVFVFDIEEELVAVSVVFDICCVEGFSSVTLTSIVAAGDVVAVSFFNAVAGAAKVAELVLVELTVVSSVAGISKVLAAFVAVADTEGNFFIVSVVALVGGVEAFSGVVAISVVIAPDVIIASLCSVVFVGSDVFDDGEREIVIVLLVLEVDCVDFVSDAAFFISTVLDSEVAVASLITAGRFVIVGEFVINEVDISDPILVVFATLAVAVVIVADGGILAVPFVPDIDCVPGNNVIAFSVVVAANIVVVFLISAVFDAINDFVVVVGNELVTGGAIFVTCTIIVASFIVAVVVDDDGELIVASITPLIPCADIADSKTVVGSIEVAGDNVLICLFNVVVGDINVVELVVAELVVVTAVFIADTISVASVVVDAEAELAIASVVTVLACVDVISSVVAVTLTIFVGDAVIVFSFTFAVSDVILDKFVVVEVAGFSPVTGAVLPSLAVDFTDVDGENLDAVLIDAGDVFVTSLVITVVGIALDLVVGGADVAFITVDVLVKILIVAPVASVDVISGITIVLSGVVDGDVAVVSIFTAGIGTVNVAEILLVEFVVFGAAVVTGTFLVTSVVVIVADGKLVAVLLVSLFACVDVDSAAFFVGDIVFVFTLTFVIGVVIVNKPIAVEIAVSGTVLLTSAVVADLVVIFAVIFIDGKIIAVTIDPSIVCVSVNNVVVISVRVVAVKFLSTAVNGVVTNDVIVLKKIFVVGNAVSNPFVVDCVVFSRVVFLLVVVTRDVFVVSAAVGLDVSGAVNINSIFVRVVDVELVMDSVIFMGTCVIVVSVVAIAGLFVVSSSTAVAADNILGGLEVVEERIFSSRVVVGAVVGDSYTSLIGGVEGLIAVFSVVLDVAVALVTASVVISVFVAGDVITVP